MTKDKIELIIVFKQEVELDTALAFLENTGTRHREGMDSSRGKLYFYKTGPKFILTFETEQKKAEFISRYESKNEVYEIYTPDWRITKD